MISFFSKKKSSGVFISSVAPRYPPVYLDGKTSLQGVMTVEVFSGYVFTSFEM